MRSPAISLDQLASLPAVYRTVIPTAYEDRNGHMNMRWYLAIYDEAGDAMYPMLGLTADYFAASGAGGVGRGRLRSRASPLVFLRSTYRGHRGDQGPHPRAELEAFPLYDVHGKRDPGQALLALRVRARSCRPESPSHRSLPGPGGRPNRRPHR